MTGLDWDNVRTTKNFAFGTAPTGKYTDPTAVLAGSWGADQTSEARVRIERVNPDCCHEVELRLRTTITAHSITGYEINCSAATKRRYMEIVRWNGPINSFDYVAQSQGMGCADGEHWLPPAPKQVFLCISATTRRRDRSLSTSISLKL